jgi:hypothetical protein
VPTISFAVASRFVCLFAGLAMLAGCSAASAVPGAAAPLAAVDAASVITTKKTVSDHLISLSRGKNCSTIRVQTGQTYCEEDERVPPKEIYCYRTIGQVNCYASPRPHGEEENFLGYSPPKPNTSP